MNKFIFFLLFFSFSVHQFVGAQSKTKDISYVKAFENTPQEQLYVHYNASLLFVGEYLYYKVYCLLGEKWELSNFSKIAYVELIGEDKNVVFRHKISLESGLGQSDFFIPTSVLSGNYKLIGYTQWMRNSKEKKFFHANIAIVNPYQGDQKRITKTNTENIKLDNDLIKNTRSLLKNNIKPNQSNENVKLVLNQKIFGKREKVSLKLKLSNTALSKVYGSLSVRKIDTIDVPLRSTVKSFKTSINKQLKETIDVSADSFFLPELRGALFSGKITAVRSDTSVENRKIVLSIPGKSYDVKIATTDHNGVFYINMDRSYEKNEAFIQVLENTDQFTIKIQEYIPLQYNDLKFDSDFVITEDMQQMILDRSVYNQISNGYFSTKPDTINLPKPTLPFYGHRLQRYDLDAYTRFPTVKETIVEIVENVRTKKIENEKYVFQIQKENPVFNEVSFDPLVVMDGLVIQDHTDIVTYNANKVKKISFSRDSYFMSSQIFHGILDIETFENDFYEKYNKSYIKKINLFTAQPKKRYFIQKYNETSSSKSNHIPDFRLQLLWLPDLKLNKEEKAIDFFTSDNVGNYEICIEGFTKDGKPISIKETILVE